MLYSLTVMAKQKWSHDHHPPHSHFDALTEQRLKECERLISKTKKAKKAIKRMRRMTLMAQK